MNTTYTCIEGDTWDNIAYRAYGDANRMIDLIVANRPLAISKRLTAGTIINIPIRPISANAVNPGLLPPWKK